MRYYITILFSIVIGGIYGQVSPRYPVNIPSSSSTFGRDLSTGTIIYDVNGDSLYMLRSAAASTATLLTTVAKDTLYPPPDTSGFVNTDLTGAGTYVAWFSGPKSITGSSKFTFEDNGQSTLALTDNTPYSGTTIKLVNNETSFGENTSRLWFVSDAGEDAEVKQWGSSGSNYGSITTDNALELFSDDDIFYNSFGKHYFLKTSSLKFSIGDTLFTHDSLVPYTNDTYSLGLDGKRFASFYSKKITDNGTSVGINNSSPSSSYALDVGGIGRFYNSGDVFHGIELDASGNTSIINSDIFSYLSISYNNNELIWDGTTLRDNDANLRGLGSSGYRWAYLYTSNITDDNTNVTLTVPEATDDTVVTMNNGVVRKRYFDFSSVSTDTTEWYLDADTIKNKSDHYVSILGNSGGGSVPMLHVNSTDVSLIEQTSPVGTWQIAAFSNSGTSAWTITDGSNYPLLIEGNKIKINGSLASPVHNLDVAGTSRFTSDIYLAASLTAGQYTLLDLSGTPTGKSLSIQNGSAGLTYIKPNNAATTYTFSDGTFYSTGDGLGSISYPWENFYSELITDNGTNISLDIPEQDWDSILVMNNNVVAKKLFPYSGDTSNHLTDGFGIVDFDYNMNSDETVEVDTSQVATLYALNDSLTDFVDTIGRPYAPTQYQVALWNDDNSIYGDTAFYIDVGGGNMYYSKNATAPYFVVHNEGGAGGAGFRYIDDASGSDWNIKATALGGFKLRDNTAGHDVFQIENGAAENSIYINSTGHISFIKSFAFRSGQTVDSITTTITNVDNNNLVTEGAVKNAIDGISSDNYGYWSISDAVGTGIRTEQVTSAEDIIFSGTGYTTTQYDSTTHTMTINSTGDNLGNHTATQNLDMATFSIFDVDTIDIHLDNATINKASDKIVFWDEDGSSQNGMLAGASPGLFQFTADTNDWDATRYWVSQQGYLSDALQWSDTNQTNGVGVATYDDLRNLSIPTLITELDANAWKAFYSDGTGDITELSLGIDGTYFRSGGTTSAPTFSTVSTVDLTSPTTWKTLYVNGSNQVTELVIGSSGQVLTSNGASAAPSWETPTTGDLSWSDTTAVGGVGLATYDDIRITDDYIAVGTGTGIEGTSDLVFDGSVFEVTGDTSRLNSVVQLISGTGDTTLYSNGDLYTRVNGIEPMYWVHNTGGNGGATFRFTDDATSTDFKFKSIGVAGGGGFKIRDNNAGTDIINITNGADANALDIDADGDINLSYNLDIDGNLTFDGAGASVDAISTTITADDNTDLITEGAAFNTFVTPSYWYGGFDSTTVAISISNQDIWATVKGDNSIKQEFGSGISITNDTIKFSYNGIYQISTSGAVGMTAESDYQIVYAWKKVGGERTLVTERTVPSNGVGSDPWTISHDCLIQVEANDEYCFQVMNPTAAAGYTFTSLLIAITKVGNYSP